MIIQKDNFLIRRNEEDKEYITSLDLKSIYLRVKKLFNFKGDLFIRLCLVYSPEEFVFFTGHNKFEKWFCGSCGYFNTVYIISPTVIEEISTHKKQELPGLIAHEISHLLYGNMRLPQFPFFNEGIANYIKYSIYMNDKLNLDINKIKIDSLKGLDKKIPEYNYAIGRFLVSRIIDLLGEEKAMEKIISFLKESNSEDSEEILFKRFEEHFGHKADDIIKLKGGKEK